MEAVNAHESRKQSLARFNQSSGVMQPSGVMQQTQQLVMRGYEVTVRNDEQGNLNIYRVLSPDALKDQRHEEEKKSQWLMDHSYELGLAHGAKMQKSKLQAEQAEKRAKQADEHAKELERALYDEKRSRVDALQAIRQELQRVTSNRDAKDSEVANLMQQLKEARAKCVEQQQLIEDFKKSSNDASLSDASRSDAREAVTNKTLAEAISLLSQTDDDLILSDDSASSSASSSASFSSSFSASSSQ